MGLRIQNNTAALNAHRHLQNTDLLVTLGLQVFQAARRSGMDLGERWLNDLIFWYRTHILEEDEQRRIESEVGGELNVAIAKISVKLANRPVHPLHVRHLVVDVIQQHQIDNQHVHGVMVSQPQGNLHLARLQMLFRRVNLIKAAAAQDRAGYGRFIRPLPRFDPVQGFGRISNVSRPARRAEPAHDKPVCRELLAP